MPSLAAAGQRCNALSPCCVQPAYWVGFGMLGARRLSSAGGLTLGGAHTCDITSTAVVSRLPWIHQPALDSQQQQQLVAAAAKFMVCKEDKAAAAAGAVAAATAQAVDGSFFSQGSRRQWQRCKQTLSAATRQTGSAQSIQLWRQRGANVLSGIGNGHSRAAAVLPRHVPSNSQPAGATAGKPASSPCYCGVVSKLRRSANHTRLWFFRAYLASHFWSPRCPGLLLRAVCSNAFADSCSTKAHDTTSCCRIIRK